MYRATAAAVEKSEAAVTQEIQAIIRQITASVTFLPLLNDTCTYAPALNATVFVLI